MKKSLYNKFKQDLGVSDAINEYIEVLLRNFEREPQSEASFQVLASQYGIRVNDVSPQVAICKIREYYIISVFQVFENFLSQLHAYMKKYCIYKESKDPSESMLKHIYKNIFGMQKISDIQYLDYLICDYYRLVRNLCAHTDNTNKVSQVYQNLQDRKDEVSIRYPKLNAPNDFQNMSFDDFVLYSRAAKNLAGKLLSNITYDVDKITKIYDLERFHVYRNNPERLKNKLEWDLNTNYSIKGEDIKIIIDKLIEII